MVSRDMNSQIQILLLRAGKMKMYRKSAWRCKLVTHCQTAPPPPPPLHPYFPPLHTPPLPIPLPPPPSPSPLSPTPWLPPSHPWLPSNKPGAQCNVAACCKLQGSGHTKVNMCVQEHWAGILIGSSTLLALLLKYFITTCMLLSANSHDMV